jgi:cytochrome c oxidase assembly protein subunit 15
VRKWIGVGAIIALLAGAGFVVAMRVTGNTDPMMSSAAKVLSQTAVGFFGVGLILAAAWFPRRREERRWVRWLSLGVLGAVIFQGILGGLRVVFVNLDLAIIHGCFAQAFFCLCALMVLATSRWWISLSPDGDRELREKNAGWLIGIALIAVLVVYGQLIVGATMRHFDAGLAIPDLPLAYGHWLPPTSAAALPAINEARADDPLLNPVTLWQIWIHFTHRIGAVLVTIALGTLVTQSLRHFRQVKLIARPAYLLIVLLLTQITLGVLTVLWRKPAEIATAHVAVGALVLVTTFVLFVRSVRLYGRGKKEIITAPAGVGSNVGTKAVAV